MRRDIITVGAGRGALVAAHRVGEPSIEGLEIPDRFVQLGDGGMPQGEGGVVVRPGVGVRVQRPRVVAGDAEVLGREVISAGQSLVVGHGGGHRRGSCCGQQRFRDAAVQQPPARERRLVVHELPHLAEGEVVGGLVGRAPRSSTMPRAISSSRPLTASSSLRPLAARTTSKVKDRPMTEAVVSSCEAPSVSEARRPRSRSPTSAGAACPPRRASRYATTRNGRPSLSRNHLLGHLAGVAVRYGAGDQLTDERLRQPPEADGDTGPRSQPIRERTAERSRVGDLTGALRDDQAGSVVAAPVHEVGQHLLGGGVRPLDVVDHEHPRRRAPAVDTARAIPSRKRASAPGSSREAAGGTVGASSGTRRADSAATGGGSADSAPAVTGSARARRSRSTSGP